MCFSPIEIKNRALRKNCCTPDKLVVPCGHCWQCRATHVSDVTLRAFFEFLNNKRHGGFAIFVTFTYDNDHLPRTIDGTPCFSREDVQKFLKRLREKVYRTYGLRQNIRYIITSEYGDDTFRPHYHAILFVTGIRSPYGFKTIVRDSWQNGIICFGDKGGIVENDAAIRYVCKYTCKDLSQQEHYQSHLQYYHSNIDMLESKITDNAYLLKRSDIQQSELAKELLNGYITSHRKQRDVIELSSLRSCLRDFIKHRPFSQTSQGFGLCALDKDENGHYIYSEYGINDKSLDNGYIWLPDKVNTRKKYHLPKYFDLKLYYNHTKVPHPVRTGEYLNVYTLNERGEQMYRARVKQNEHIISNTINKIKAYVGLEQLEQLNLKCVEKQFNLHFDNLQDFHKYLDTHSKICYSEKTFCYRGIEYTESHDVWNVWSCPRSADVVLDGIYLKKHNEFHNTANSEILRDIFHRAADYNLQLRDFRNVVSCLLDLCSKQIEAQSAIKEKEQIKAKLEKRRLYRQTHHIPYLKC